LTKLQADHGLYLTFNGRLHVFQILGGHRLALLPQIAAVAPSLTASEPTMRWFLHASEIKPRTWENCVRFKVLHLTKLQAAHGLYLTFYGRLHVFQILGGHRLALLPQIAAVAPQVAGVAPTPRSSS